MTASSVKYGTTPSNPSHSESDGVDPTAGPKKDEIGTSDAGELGLD